MYSGDCDNNSIDVDDDDDAADDDESQAVAENENNQHFSRAHLRRRHCCYCSLHKQQGGIVHEEIDLKDSHRVRCSRLQWKFSSNFPFN